MFLGETKPIRHIRQGDDAAVHYFRDGRPWWWRDLTIVPTTGQQWIQETIVARSVGLAGLVFLLSWWWSVIVVERVSFDDEAGAQRVPLLADGEDGEQEDEHKVQKKQVPESSRAFHRDDITGGATI
jgi:hypothetical protein